MECNPFNISTGAYESFTFLEINYFLVVLFILILISIKYSGDRGQRASPSDNSAEGLAVHDPCRSVSIPRLQLCTGA